MVKARANLAIACVATLIATLLLVLAITPMPRSAASVSRWGVGIVGGGGPSERLVRLSDPAYFPVGRDGMRNQLTILRFVKSERPMNLPPAIVPAPMFETVRYEVRDMSGARADSALLVQAGPLLHADGAISDSELAMLLDGRVQASRLLSAGILFSAAYWAMVATMLYLALWYMRVARERRLRRVGWCHVCEYPLINGTCPECGAKR